jgi:hypothetical protein
MSDKANNIKVMVRVRPLNSREKQEDSKTCVEFDESQKGKLILGPTSFTYDWVGGLDTRQQDIYDYIGVPLVNTCLEGIILSTIQPQSIFFWFYFSKNHFFVLF